jgi:integrase
MDANIPKQQNLTAGSVVAKGAYFYIVMSWYEQPADGESGAKPKKKTKWLPTRIAVSEPKSKTKAKDLLSRVRVVFDRDNPAVSINVMLAHENKTLEQGGLDFIDSGEILLNKSADEVKKDRGILFSDYLLLWLEEIRSRVEITTFASYQRNITGSIAPYFKDKGLYLSELTAQDIHLFYKEMRKSGLKAETVIRYHANIRKAIVDALEFDETYNLDANILVKLKKPFKPEKEKFVPNFYSVDEINGMLKAFTGHRLELVVKLAAFYGFRREEVLGLKWNAIDFTNNTITVSHTVTQCCVDGKARMVYKDRGKNPASRRTMPLVESVGELLKARKKAVEENRNTFGKTYVNKFNEYICVDDNGDMIKPGYVTKNFVKTLELSGLRRIRFHDLRHSCASMLVYCGVAMKLIQEWLGHSNFSTTADRYSHLEHFQKVESANALANIGINLT